MSHIIKSLAAGPVPPSVATSYVTNNGTAIPVANVLNVLGDNTTATTSASGNTITVKVIDDGFTWSEQATSFNIAVENGYFVTAAATASLPPTAGLTIGNACIIYVDSASSVTIQANTGQFIQYGQSSSVSGGTLASNAIGSTVELIFRPTDSTWHTISSEGTWTLT